MPQTMGTGVSLQSLEEWIHETVIDPDKPGRCTQLALVHMTGSVENELHVKKLPDKIDATLIAEWAETFDRLARNYAAGVPGAQTFCLLAFHANAPHATAKQPFVRAGYTEIDGLMTEGPTGKGFMQQMMRHNEAIISQGAQQTRILFEAMTRALDSKTKESETLRRENIEGFAFIKQLVLGMADKQHEHRLAQIEAQQSTQLRNELMKWAPQLLNAATGREIIPQTMADTTLVEGFIDALARRGEAALPELARLNLPPPLLAAFAHRFQQGVLAREREQAARKTVDDDNHPIDGGLQ